MLIQLRDFVVGEGWSDLTLLPFFSMVDRRRALHQELIASAREQFPAMLATEVPYSSEIERMSVRRAPLPACAPRSEPARIYGALWAEIRERLEAAPHRAAAVAGGRYPESDEAPQQARL
jgi:chromosome partitioning protein